ncbi:MAG TPA: hypothetical protein VIY48_12200 [Candidatus Paceibacterota bacterium]
MLKCLAQMLSEQPLTKVNAIADPVRGLASREAVFSLSAAREWLDKWSPPDETEEDRSLRKWTNNKHLYRELYGLNAKKAFQAYIADLERPGGKVLAEKVTGGKDALVCGDVQGEEGTIS